MAGGRSCTASMPGKKRVGRKGVGATSSSGKGHAARATARKRTVVLDGTFSIEEIEVKGTSRRKAAKSARKRAVPKKSASPKKKTSPKKKATPKKKVGKKVAGGVKRVTKPKAAKKPATVKTGPVVLASSPGIKSIAELKDTLAKAHSAGSPVIVDASGVESIDTAALQLLVAFANSTRERSRTVEWKEPSTVFCEMADLADLTQDLGIGDDSVAEEDDGLCPVF